jgi:hypothetical protein
MLIPLDHSWLPVEIRSHGGFPLRHTDKHASNQRELKPSQIEDGFSRIGTRITVSYYELTSAGNFGAGWQLVQIGLLVHDGSY